MPHQNKNLRIFVYIVLIFLLIWSGLNFGSYTFLKNYLLKNNSIIKDKIIDSFNLDKNHEYEFNLNPQIHWGFIFLNIYIENVEFSDKTSGDLKIYIKNLNLSFLISKILTRKFVPYAIQSNKINLILKEDFLKKIFGGNKDSKENKFNKENLKKILLVKNFNLEKFNIQIISKDLEKPSFFHFFKNLEIQKIGKRTFEFNSNYLNNKNIENFKTSFVTKFNLNDNLIKISKLKNFLIIKDPERFPEIKKINIENSGSGKLFLKDSLQIEKIIFDFHKFNMVFFGNSLKDVPISRIDLIKKNENNIEIEYDLKKNNIKIDEFDFSLNNKKIFKTNALLEFQKNGIKKINQKISLISEMSHDDLKIFWPTKFFSDTKKWVEKSIQSGKVKNAKIFLDLFFDSNWKFLEQKSKINGALDFDHLKIDLKTEMIPEIQELSGNLNFDMNKLNANIKTGFVEIFNKEGLKEKIVLNSGFTKIDFSDLKIRIGGALKTSMKKLLNFYDKEFKIDILGEDIIENINGNGIVNFETLIDLSSKNSSNEIIKNIKIQTSDLETFIRNDGNSLNFKKGNIKIDVNNLKDSNFHDVKIEGSGFLNEKEFKIVTNRNSESKNQIISNANFFIDYKDVKNVLDPIIGSAVKIDEKIGINAELINHLDSKNDEFNLEIDLKDASLKADYAKIKKEKGEKANLIFNMIKTPENDFFLKDLELTQGKDELLISKINYYDSKKETDIFCLKFNNSLIYSIIFQSLNEKNLTKIIAQNINYYDFDWLGFEGDDKNKSNFVEGFVENLIFLNDLKIKNLNLNIECDSEKCHTMNLKNNPLTQKGNHLDANLKNDKIEIFSDNAGLLLRGMNFVKYIFGGKLELKGNLNQYKNKQFIIQNDLVIKDFYLKNAPAVAHLLSLASITGAFSDLTGKGIHFSKMTSNFVYYNDKIEFGKSIANGLSMGFSFDGNVDLTNDFFDIEGSIMPFNFLNMALKKVPLIGEALTGKPGEGFFSIDFDASGTFEKPTYKVDAFRAFMPYFLKKIFYKKKQKIRDI